MNCGCRLGWCRRTDRGFCKLQIDINGGSVGSLWFSVVSFDYILIFFFFQAEDGIRDTSVTGVQTCALPILPIVLLQFGESASVTVTSVRATSPVLVTVIVKVAAPPLVTVCDFGFLTITIAGCVAGATAVTTAVSLAETSGPTGGFPVAIATFVRLAVTFAREQV